VRLTEKKFNKRLARQESGRRGSGRWEMGGTGTRRDREGIGRAGKEKEQGRRQREGKRKEERRKHTTIKLKHRIIIKIGSPVKTSENKNFLSRDNRARVTFTWRRNNSADSELKHFVVRGESLFRRLEEEGVVLSEVVAKTSEDQEVVVDDAGRVGKGSRDLAEDGNPTEMSGVEGERGGKWREGGVGRREEEGRRPGGGR
jgi:hypothetical protein